MIQHDWLKPKNTRERMIMITKAKTARIIILFAYFIMGATVVIGIALPACGLSMRYLTNITDPGKPLPLQTYYVYDITKSPQYELTFLCQSIGIVLAILPYTGIDNFLSLLVFHICGQLKILKYRIMQLDKFGNFNDTLRSCIIDHTRLLR